MRHESLRESLTFQDWIIGPKHQTELNVLNLVLFSLFIKFCFEGHTLLYSGLIPAWGEYLCVCVVGRV